MRESVCVRERESVCVCVYMCLCVRECVCECVCVCERERGGERECVCVRVRVCGCNLRKDFRQKLGQSSGSSGLLLQTCGMLLFFLFEELGSKTSDKIYNKTIQPGAVCMPFIQFSLQNIAKQLQTRGNMYVYCYCWLGSEIAKHLQKRNKV